MKAQLIKLVQLIIILIGALLLLDAAYIAYVSNFNVGQVIVAVLGMALIGYALIWRKSSKESSLKTALDNSQETKPAKRKLPKWLHAAVALVCTFILGFCIFLGAYGKNSTVDYTEDVVIVLGAAVHGERVSLTLAHRLDAAAEYHAQNPHALIVVSGGQGPQEDITEALAMERYLLARGVSPDVIIQEDESTSTLENFLFSDALLQEEFDRPYTVAVITTDFHVYRATGIAEIAGIDVRHIGAPSIWYAIPVNYLREILAVMQFWVFPPSP